MATTLIIVHGMFEGNLIAYNSGMYMYILHLVRLKTGGAHLRLASTKMYAVVLKQQS